MFEARGRVYFKPEEYVELFGRIGLQLEPDLFTSKTADKLRGVCVSTRSALSVVKATAPEKLAEARRLLAEMDKSVATKSESVVVAPPQEIQEEAPPAGAWILSGDKRGLVELPEGSEFSFFGGITRVGKTNRKTGAVTLWIRTSRYPAKEGDENVYGLGFYFKPRMIRGEQIVQVEQAVGIGVVSMQDKEATNG